MVNPLVQDRGSSTTIGTTSASLANNAYVSIGRMQLSSFASAYLVGDFRLTGVVFGTAPTTGSIQIVLVPRDFSGNAGPAPSATLASGTYITMSVMPLTSNTATTLGPMGADRVPLPYDCDVYLFNNGTGQSINSGVAVIVMPWSPGT